MAAHPWLLKTLSSGDSSVPDVSGANDIGLKRRTLEHNPRRRPKLRGVRATLESPFVRTKF